jgi:hypothetical protein
MDFQLHYVDVCYYRWQAGRQQPRIVSRIGSSRSKSAATGTWLPTVGGRCSSFPEAYIWRRRGLRILLGALPRLLRPRVWYKLTLSIREAGLMWDGRCTS